MSATPPAVVAAVVIAGSRDAITRSV